MVYANQVTLHVYLIKQQRKMNLIGLSLHNNLQNENIIFNEIEVVNMLIFWCLMMASPDVFKSLYK
jgi:hypothetical protein